MVNETGFGLAKNQRTSTYGAIATPGYANIVTSYALMEAEIDATYETIVPYESVEIDAKYESIFPPESINDEKRNSKA